MAKAVATSTFRIAPSAYAGAMMRKWLAVWGWAVALPPLGSAAVAAAEGDVRYLLLGFVLLCMVAPLALLIVYYYYALDPRARLNVVLHTVATDGAALTVTILGEPDDEGGEPLPKATESIAAVYAVGYTRGAMRLALAPGRLAPLLVVPYSAFRSAEELREFSRLLNALVNNG